MYSRTYANNTLCGTAACGEIQIVRTRGKKAMRYNGTWWQVQVALQIIGYVATNNRAEKRRNCLGQHHHQQANQHRQLLIAIIMMSVRTYGNSPLLHRSAGHEVVAYTPDRPTSTSIYDIYTRTDHLHSSHDAHA